MKHGLGEFKSFAKRQIFKGYFYNDMFHGQGILKYPDGRVYKGQFKKGERSGYGECFYRTEGSPDI